MIAGADEAGRGPILGPMVLGVVLSDERVQEELKSDGIRDSKILSPKRREKLAELIRKKASKVEIIEISNVEIDESRLVKNVNLNELEAMKFAQLIEKLNPKLVYMDSPDPNPELFEKRIRKYLKVRPKLVVENFADRNYPLVAAASIVAKVYRDHCVAKLHGRYGDFGSGYPADPRTITFLNSWVQEHGKLPDFARKSWATARRIEGRTKQRKID